MNTEDDNKDADIWNKRDDGWMAGSTGDDPSVRELHPPTAKGPGDGLAFFFLFGLKTARRIDQDMVRREREAIADDIAVLQGAGYTVVVDPQATRADLVAAVTGRAEAPPAGIYWSAHGHPDGSVEACDGDKIPPDSLPTAEVSPALKLFIMSACYSAARARTWRNALGGAPLVVGWGRPVTIDRAVDFLTPAEESESDLDDLIRRYLVQGHPVPKGAADIGDQPAWTNGSIERLRPLLPSLSTALSGEWRETDGRIELRVRTEGRRMQVVRLSVVDSDRPFTEGHALLAAESEVGELTRVVDPVELFQEGAAPGFARIALVKGGADLPVILVQGFLPLERNTLQELAGLIQEVALRADALEKRIFGGDFG